MKRSLPKINIAAYLQCVIKGGLAQISEYLHK